MGDSLCLFNTQALLTEGGRRCNRVANAKRRGSLECADVSLVEAAGSLLWPFANRDAIVMGCSVAVCCSVAREGCSECRAWQFSLASGSSRLLRTTTHLTRPPSDGARMIDSRGSHL
jgi:hypothetical protein